MDRVTRQAIRSFPRGMWVVAAGNFVNRFGGFVVPMLALRITDLGYTKGEAGTVLGVYGAGKLASVIAAGTWTDRYGHRAVILASAFSSAAVMLGMAALTDYTQILIAALVLGFASELFRTPMSALIAEFSAPENRITAFALNRLAVNAGFAFGPAIGGMLAHWSFTWVFIGNATTEILYGLIAWRGLPARVTSGLQSAEAGGRADGSWREVFADRRLVLFLAAIFPITFIYMQSISSFALYTADQGLTPSEYGRLLSFNGVLIVTCELSLTAVTRRFDPRHVLMLGYALLGFGYALTGFVHTFWPLGGVVVLWTLGEMISAPPQGAVLANMAPDRLRARYMGASGFLWGAAVIVGPWLGTLLYAWSPTALWVFSAGVGLASAAMVHFALRR